jgi:hypothetical protein
MNGTDAVCPIGSRVIASFVLNADVAACYCQVVSSHRGLDCTVHEHENPQQRIMEIKHLVGHNGSNAGAGEGGTPPKDGFQTVIGATSWEGHDFWNFAPNWVHIRTLEVEMQCHGTYNVYLMVWTLG